MIYKFYSDDYNFDRLSKKEILEYKKYLYKCLKNEKFCKEYILNKLFILNNYIFNNYIVKTSKEIKKYEN